MQGRDLPRERRSLPAPAFWEHTPSLAASASGSGSLSLLAEILQLLPRVGGEEGGAVLLGPELPYRSLGIR